MRSSPPISFSGCMRRTGATFSSARGRLLTWTAKLTVSFLAEPRAIGSLVAVIVTGSGKISDMSLGPLLGASPFALFAPPCGALGQPLSRRRLATASSKDGVGQRIVFVGLIGVCIAWGAG